MMDYQKEAAELLDVAGRIDSGHIDAAAWLRAHDARLLRECEEIPDEWDRAYSLEIFNDVTIADYGKAEAENFVSRWSGKVGRHLSGLIRRQLRERATAIEEGKS